MWRAVAQILGKRATAMAISGRNCYTPDMSFGRNPFVAKATLAEQKAQDAGDRRARVQAHRDAANLWERAAEREQPGKQRVAYEAKANEHRQSAEAAEAEGA
jgi:hypothetical protein